MDARPSWADYEAFHLRLGEGYWFDRIIPTPYGPLLSGTTATLFAHNLTAEPATVIATCQHLIGNPDGAIEFFFSPGTRGDLDAFTRALATLGYACRFTVAWYALAPSPTPADPALRRARPEDAATLAQVEDICFPNSPHDRDALIALVTTPRTAVTDLVLIHRDPATGQDTGIIAAASHGPFGYVHDMGVLPAYRKRGYARSLMAGILSRLHAAGVTCVVSAADVANADSVALHLKRGYQPFAQTESWHIPSPAAPERTPA